MTLAFNDLSFAPLAAGCGGGGVTPANPEVVATLGSQIIIDADASIGVTLFDFTMPKSEFDRGTVLTINFSATMAGNYVVDIQADEAIIEISPFSASGPNIDVTVKLLGRVIDGMGVSNFHSSVFSVLQIRDSDPVYVGYGVHAGPSQEQSGSDFTDVRIQIKVRGLSDTAAFILNNLVATYTYQL